MKPSLQSLPETAAGQAAVWKRDMSVELQTASELAALRVEMARLRLELARALDELAQTVGGVNAVHNVQMAALRAEIARALEAAEPPEIKTVNEVQDGLETDETGARGALGTGARRALAARGGAGDRRARGARRAV